MIPTIIAEAVRNAYHNYRDASGAGFIEREPQKRFMSLIAKTISMVPDEELPDGYTAPVLVAQGKTGTGKTIAYLLASLASAKEKHKKIVISTATVALQEQLFKRDIPAVQEKSGLEFSVALAKGRQRFVCLTKLKSATSGEMDMFGDPSESFVSPESLELHEQLSEAFDSKKWDGDKDSWPEVIASDRWSEVSTDSSGCSGANCSEYNRCPFYSAKRDILDCDVIVANHDLVLTSLRHGGSLPDAEESFFIFDEAHHLPPKTLSHAAHSHRVRSSVKWVRKSVGDMKSALTAVYGHGYTADPASACLIIDDQVGSIVDYLNHASAIFDTFPAFNAGNTNRSEPLVHRFTDGQVPAQLEEVASLICSPAKAVIAKLEKVKDSINRKIRSKDMEKKSGEVQTAVIGHLLNSYTNLLRVWESYLDTVSKNGEHPKARWVTQHINGSDIDYTVSISPIIAAPMLKELIWDQCAGAVLTSATLTALGKFDRFADLSGLDTHQKVHFESLASTFDYQANASIRFPELRSDPTRGDVFTEEITEWFTANLNLNQATLVLFTSYYQMNAVLRALPHSLRQHISVQGDTSNGELIANHKALVDQGKPSIVCGVDSLAEGVDLPGKYLTRVVIAKLPFAPPVEPVAEAYAEHLTKLGRNPFMEVAVPDAAVKLVQAVGRLCRTESDKGEIIILDRRLLTKRYGSEMMKDLPPMKMLYK